MCNSDVDSHIVDFLLMNSTFKSLTRSVYHLQEPAFAFSEVLISGINESRYKQVIVAVDCECQDLSKQQVVGMSLRGQPHAVLVSCRCLEHPTVPWHRVQVSAPGRGGRA